MPPPDSSRERTRLSWRRTTLVATVVAILLARLALRDREGIGVLGIAALCWVGLLVVVQRRVAGVGQDGEPLRGFAPGGGQDHDSLLRVRPLVHVEAGDVLPVG